MNQTLSARNIVKRYGGVVALADGHLDVTSGEVVTLIGANGSGKSTMSKVINGVVVLDRGQLLLDDRPVQFSSPQAAKDMGISTVFQELSLIPQMTVADNIWLTREPRRGFGVINRKEVIERTQELLTLFKGTYKTDLTPDTLVSTLPPDERQIIEILKSISFDPWMIILDEATASLDSRQVERLFDLVSGWKEQGKAIVFVSHRMEEIFRIADCYSVLRNGTTVGAGDIADVNEKELVRLMVEKETIFAFARTASEVALERPPRCPRVPMLLTNTSLSRLCSCIRIRSPRSAPPENGLDGSTQIIPTELFRALYSAVILVTSVLLPEPGGPVIPITLARPVFVYNKLSASDAAGSSSSIRVMSRARSLLLPVRTPSASSSADTIQAPQY